MADADSGIDHSSTKRKHEADGASSQQQDTPPKRQRVIGPQLPTVDQPAVEDKESIRSGSEDEDDSSDDDFGPALPPGKGVGSGQEAADARSLQDTDGMYPAPLANETKPGGDKVQQRDEWMLNPPDRSSWSINVDPTALRNRRFATGRAARTSRTDQNGMSSKWTETVAEKRQRLENEVMGIETRSETSTQHAPGDRPRQSEKIIAEKVRALNVSSGRGCHCDSVCLSIFSIRTREIKLLYTKHISAANPAHQAKMIQAHGRLTGRRILLPQQRLIPQVVARC